MSVSNLLNKNFCDKLVQSSSLTTGHNILVTDEEGYIIASSEPERIGSLHEASIKVIHSGQRIYHDRNAVRSLAGTKPGMTIPIRDDTHVIGTIGITGAPHEISQYAMLIQQFTQIFINFQSQQLIATDNQYKMQAFIREFTTYTNYSQYQDSLREKAYEFGIDLSAPHVAVLLETLPSHQTATPQDAAQQRRQLLERLRQHFSARQDFAAPSSDSEYIILASMAGQDAQAAVLRKLGALEAEAVPAGIRFRIGIGTPAASLEALRLSYEKARLAVRILRCRLRQTTCLAICDASFEALADSLPDKICAELEETLLAPVFAARNRDEILLTIEQWYRSGFNFMQTAQALHIHKSTLLYRFRRILETCGLDLHDLDKAIAAYALIVRQRLEK